MGDGLYVRIVYFNHDVVHRFATFVLSNAHGHDLTEQDCAADSDHRRGNGDWKLLCERTKNA